MKKTLEEDEKWSRATIRIMGKDLRPEEIESALGLKATRAHLRGEVRSLKHKAVWRESLWSLQSPLASEVNLADHLKWLLDLLEPKRDVIKRTFWKISDRLLLRVFLGKWTRRVYAG